MRAFQTHPIHDGIVAGIAHIVLMRSNVRLCHRRHLLLTLHGE